MKRCQLRDTHPTAQKLQKIFDLMEDLGIEIDPHSYGTAQTIVMDKEFPGIRFNLQDLDHTDSNYYPVSFPPSLEYKITYEKDEITREE